MSAIEMHETQTATGRQERSARLERLFAVACLAVLGATTIVWSFLGAHLQSSNADQIVNILLFQNRSTSHGAVFPGAHTFLLKWPLFYLINITGPTNSAIIASTVLVSLSTVGALAYILYRIDRRPLVFGLTMLALASVLLLVPPQPLAGALLPVNMAMITTRNLEYILYIAGLALLISAPKKPRSWRLWVAVTLLGLLMASDNLYELFSVGGAALAALTYFFARRWPLARSSAIWLGAGVAGVGLVAGSLRLINALGLTHIRTTSFGTPYGLVSNLQNALRGIAYSALGVLTNLGANPAFDAAKIDAVPGRFFGRLIGPYGLAFAVNVGLAAIAAYAVTRLLWSSIVKSTQSKSRLDNATTLSLFLIFSSMVGVGAYVATRHDYVVDARYLSIVLFAAFVSAATFLRSWKVPNHKRFAAIVGALLCSISLGVPFALHTYDVDRQAMRTMNGRNAIVSQALKSHPVNALVGSYWRVVPVKSLVDSSMRVVPLDGCTKPRSILSSSAWQEGYLSHSFAYLLTLDRRFADFPECALKQIVSAYGEPNASSLVAGTFDKPTEILLFYDRGVHKSAPVTSDAESPTQGTVLPISLDQLPDIACPEGTPTTMNIVAHEDDDLLFLSPDLVHDIKARHCVRTIFVTAGDAGGDRSYWLGRERGSFAAYTSMLSLPADTVWYQRIVTLSAHQSAMVASPSGNPFVSLIFLRLPDGNIHGEGFQPSRDESLARLESDRVRTLHSVDGQSTYSSDELVDALVQLMTTYTPDEVRTQAKISPGNRIHDHSDHMAVGRYADRAFSRYGGEHAASIKYYIGYPSREMPQNVSGDDLHEKMRAFTTYGGFDNAVCHTADECDHVPTYGSYLRRQYTIAP